MVGLSDAGSRQDPHGGAMPQSALNDNCTMMAAHNSLDACQPQSAPGELCCEKRIENLFDRSVVNSASCINYVQINIVSAVQVVVEMLACQVIFTD